MKFGEALFAQVSSAVEIFAAWLIARSEVTFVGVDVERKAACNRPDCPGLECVHHRRVRHKTRNAAIAVEEWMNPRKAVMRRASRENGLGCAEPAVDLFEPLEEARHCGCADRDVPANDNITVPQLSWNDFDLFLSITVILSTSNVCTPRNKSLSNSNNAWPWFLFSLSLRAPRAQRMFR